MATDPLVRIEYEIRLSTAADVPFVGDSWYRTARHTYPNQYDIDFPQAYPLRIKRLLESSLVLIAHLKGQPDEILGYMVYTFFQQVRIVHFAYVKVDARRLGILNALLKFCDGGMAEPVVFTTPAKSESLMTFLSSRFLFTPSMQNQ